MTERYSTGSRWEPVVGYSRAVKAGGFVFVSGCTSTVDGEVTYEGDHYAQAKQALANLVTALEALGARAADVVRTRMFVTDISRWEDYGRAHGEVFGEVLPATTMVGVTAFVDPRMLVEIEADAWVGP
jgi:enamine deaminase RidA (YjgF/YER057c/UK114 family)